MRVPLTRHRVVDGQRTNVATADRVGSEPDGKDDAALLRSAVFQLYRRVVPPFIQFGDEPFEMCARCRHRTPRC